MPHSLHLAMSLSGTYSCTSSHDVCAPVDSRREAHGAPFNPVHHETANKAFSFMAYSVSAFVSEKPLLSPTTILSYTLSDIARFSRLAQRSVQAALETSYPSQTPLNARWLPILTPVR